MKFPQHKKGRYINISEDKKTVHDAELMQKESAAVVGGRPPLVNDQDILERAGIKSQKTERLSSVGNTHEIL